MLTLLEVQEYEVCCFAMLSQLEVDLMEIYKDIDSRQYILKELELVETVLKKYIAMMKQQLNYNED